MGRIIAAATFLCYMLLAIAPIAAIALPIATPAPGTATPLPAPTGNPVQYVVAPGQTGSSTAQNSNFYKVYQDVNAVITSLNGCSYVPGAAIGAVTANSPVTASLSTCLNSSGTGETLTLGLSHGDYDDLTNAQTVGGAKTFSNAATFSAGLTSNGNIVTTGLCTTGCPAGYTNGDLGVNRGNGTAAIVFGGTTTHYELFTGSQFSFTDNVSAPNFFTGSRRKWKQNITPYRFDPLATINAIDFKEYDCRTIECGPVGVHKVGIIADDSPVQVAGDRHDHYDAFALAAIDGAAIRELALQVRIMQILGVASTLAGMSFGALMFAYTRERRRA